MIKRIVIGVLLLFVVTLVGAAPVAQGELAATLEVLSAGVEVQRVNTVNWIPVRVEGIVGVGDVIRTDAAGRARVTFFADGTDTEILASTEYRINAFSGGETSFTLNAEVLVGQTVQRLNRLVDANSSYNIETPAMSLVARGTQFSIRVEANGRAAMLVQEGEVNADAATVESAAVVPSGFGVRAAAAAPVSDVVQATTFSELDAALDGCTGTLTTPDDVSINVRAGASRDFARLGFVDAASIGTLFGITASGDWYRIQFEGGFGWILSSDAQIAEGCAGLRTFPDTYSEVDNGVSNPATPTALPPTRSSPLPTSAPTATALPGS